MLTTSFRRRAAAECWAGLAVVLLLAPGRSGAQPPPLDAGARDAGVKDAGVAWVGPVPLIPRAALLGNPEKASPKLSPDGKRLAWLAPDEKNVLQAWVRTVGQSDDAPVTSEPKRGLRSITWAEDSTTLLYLQDFDGDENFHLWSVDLLGKNTRDLTPWLGIRAGLLPTSARVADQLLVTLNVRDRKLFDVYRVSLKTGAVELDTQNPGDVTGWLADASLTVRGAVATTKEGGTEVRVRDAKNGPWRPLITVGLEEHVEPYDFSLDTKTLFLATTVASDTARLVEKSVKTGTERVMAQNATVDVSDVWVHPVKHSVLAARFEVDGKPEWTSLDYTVTGDLNALKAQLGTGNFTVTSMDRADQTWVVSVSTDVVAPRWVLWERRARKLTPLFSALPKLEGLPLAPSTPVSIPVKDGFTMQGFLTVPVGPESKRPLVLLVHGGPWWKDSFGFNPVVQLLANRGYAVLQVNYRGSTGSGKRFLSAGNREWGRAMQDDLSLAVTWARDANLADPAKVAIMGQSYGGYATLAGLAFTPEHYRCGVDAFGPSNLFTLLATVPPYFEAYKAEMYQRVGDPNDPADRELLTQASPVFAAEAVKAPLFIAQGANDPRVKASESEQMFQALEKRGVPMTYVVYPDEGHGFSRPENRLDYVARVEGFLARCLGGKAEPLPKEGRVEGSTAVVKTAGPKK